MIGLERERFFCLRCVPFLLRFWVVVFCCACCCELGEYVFDGGCSCGSLGLRLMLLSVVLWGCGFVMSSNEFDFALLFQIGDPFFFLFYLPLLSGLIIVLILVFLVFWVSFGPSQVLS